MTFLRSANLRSAKLSRLSLFIAVFCLVSIRADAKANVYYYCDWYYECGDYDDGECQAGYWVPYCDFYDDGEEPGGGGGGNDPGMPGYAKVTKASITDNEVIVELSPANWSGRLQVIAHRDDGSYSVLSDESRSGSSGSITVSFNNGGLPTGMYQDVEATWYAMGVGARELHGTEPVQFRVLGTYHHSQYNLPYEGVCGGGPVARDIAPSESQCTTHFSDTLRYDFSNKVDINGTGTSISHGILHTTEGTNCRHELSGSHFFMKESATGSWGRLYDDTVAKGPSHPFLSPNDHVFLVGYNGAYREKEVTDFCPGCETTHLDNFTSGSACYAYLVGDIGDLPTIRLR